MRFLKAVVILLWKEIRIELRAKEILYSSVLFASIVVLLFSFAFLGTEPPSSEVKAGILWVALSFTGILSIQRCFAKEREGDMFQALLLTPAPRFSIYMAKFLSMLLLLLITMIFILPLLVLFLQLQATSWLWLGLILMLGMTGFVAIACLFAAPLGKMHGGSFLLPMLVYPLMIPILLAGVRGTCHILCDASLSLIECQALGLKGASWSETLRWIRFLGIFDLLVFLLSAWLFEPLCSTE